MLCEKIYDQAAIQTKSLYSHHRQAIIMDLDETVLDNSQYQVELYKTNTTFNMESWSKWVKEENANLVPGVLKFINKVREKNIQLIFISNRMDARLRSTKKNMKKLGLYSENDIYLLRKDKEDKKTVRRNEVYSNSGRMKNHKKYKVIQYFGDAMGDFPQHQNDIFGIDQFMLPNPMYGKWLKYGDEK